MRPGWFEKQQRAGAASGRRGGASLFKLNSPASGFFPSTAAAAPLAAESTTMLSLPARSALSTFRLRTRTAGPVLASARAFSSSRAAFDPRKPPALLSLADLSVGQIQSLIDTAGQFKAVSKAISLADSDSAALRDNSEFEGEDVIRHSLAGQTIAIMFTKRSTRTRVASETSVNMLGGHPLFLAPSDIQLGVNETLYDSAKVISSMVDGIFARVGSHDDIEVLAKESAVPVVNALSERYHPTQILADLLTMAENFPRAEANAQSTSPAGTSLRALAGLKVAWVGDSNNILNDILVAFPRLGIDVSVAAPVPKDGMYAKDPVVFSTLDKLLAALPEDETFAKAGYRPGKVTWTHSPEEAVAGADILVTDTWISMGDEASKEQRLRDFEGFQITEDLARRGGANPSWKFMHCLPRKPQEVDDEVFYGPRSLVFPEAENRKWTIMAIFEYVNLLHPHPGRHSMLCFADTTLSIQSRIRPLGALKMSNSLRSTGNNSQWIENHSRAHRRHMAGWR